MVDVHTLDFRGYDIWKHSFDVIDQGSITTIMTETHFRHLHFSKKTDQYRAICPFPLDAHVNKLGNTIAKVLTTDPMHYTTKDPSTYQVNHVIVRNGVLTDVVC